MVGLGYEENKTLGAVEHIQAATILTFTPISPVEAYTPALDEANRTLLNLVPNANRFTYNVGYPLETFVELESFTFGITRTHNLIMLPFGPKIFTLCSMLVGMIHPEVALWRVSGGKDRVDRRANGDVFGLSVEFESTVVE
jgi:hypothetical protein